MLSVEGTFAQHDPLFDRHELQRELQKRQIHGLQRPASDSVFTVLGRWGWGPCEAVDVKGNYAYIGNGPTFQVLDISNPSSPRIVGEYLTDGYVTDIHVRNSLAFIATGNLLILDVSVPQAPKKLSETTIGVLIARIAVADSFAYVAGQGGVFVVDVTDPANPYVRGRHFPGGNYVDCLEARQGYIYFGSYEFSGVEVYDARNPDTLRVTSGIYDDAVTAGFLSDTLLFLGVAPSAQNCPLQVFSVSRPDSAILLGEVTIGYYIGSITASGSTVYLANDSGQVCAVDVSDPRTPIIRSRCGPMPPELRGGRAIAQSAGVVFAAQYSGLRILDAPSADSLHRDTFFPTGGFAQKIVLKNKLALVPSFVSGLWILDVSDPQNPQPVSNINVGGYAVDVVVSDTLAYLVNYAYYYPDDSTRGLWVISIADSSHPKAISHHIGIARTPPGTIAPNSLAKEGNLILMTQVGSPTYDSTLELIDVTDPRRPTSLSVYKARYLPYRALMRDSLAYVAMVDSGLEIIDFHNPLIPKEMSRLLPNAVGLALKDSFAIVFGSQMWVVDVSIPASPVIENTLPLGFNMVDLSILGNYLYYAGQTLGVIDISNPVTPVPKGAFSGLDWGTGVAVAGNVVYYADRRDGIWILRNNLITSVAERNELPLPNTVQLLPNFPNPFNPETTIEYVLPKRTDVKLEIFNVLGQRVASLAEGFVDAGGHKVRFTAGKLSSGTYFCRLTVGGTTISRKLLLCK
jgi:hypothetical protein